MLERYTLVSEGIHALEEEECLAMFPLMRDSIVMMVEENEKRKKSDARKKALSAGLSKLQREGKVPKD